MLHDHSQFAGRQVKSSPQSADLLAQRLVQVSICGMRKKQAILQVPQAVRTEVPTECIPVQDGDHPYLHIVITCPEHPELRQSRAGLVLV